MDNFVGPTRSEKKSVCRNLFGVQKSDHYQTEIILAQQRDQLLKGLTDKYSFDFKAGKPTESSSGVNRFEWAAVCNVHDPEVESETCRPEESHVPSDDSMAESCLASAESTAADDDLKTVNVASSTNDDDPAPSGSTDDDVIDNHLENHPPATPPTAKKLRMNGKFFKWNCSAFLYYGIFAYLIKTIVYSYTYSNSI